MSPFISQANKNANTQFSPQMSTSIVMEIKYDHLAPIPRKAMLKDHSRR